MQGEHYCEHFRNLKFSKTIQINQQSCCKFCFTGKNYLWFCLAKNCGSFVCDRNQKEHILRHLEQSKNKKLFHSIFINVLTARIICIHCNIQIYDLDILKLDNYNLPDPYFYRLKILPSLQNFDSEKNKIMGQLQNSEGHKRISKALTGFFGNKYNHAINSALQFLMQFQLFRDITLNIKTQDKEIQQMARIFYQAQQAEFRAIPTDELIKILIKENPDIQSYKRKDPFMHIIYFMTKIHQIIKYYTNEKLDFLNDEWYYLGNPTTASKLKLNCPLFDNTTITLSLNYSCQKCPRQKSLLAYLNFLKLSFPKKKRKQKQVQKQLADHRFDSPVKNRRKSLIDYLKKQEQFPFTVAELLIQFLKQPLHKDKICQVCKSPMKKCKNHFQNLPQYLIIQINRMGSDGNSIDFTNLQFNHDSIDLSSFTSNKDESLIYKFEAAVCVENYCSFPVVAKSRFNKQTYIFKNQIVSMLKSQKTQPNPYILCYKKQCPKRNELKLKDCYHNIKSSIQIQDQKEQNKNTIPLPDFWLCQLKNSIQRPLYNQLFCQHKKLKPNIQSKMKYCERVPIQVYNYLLQMFKGQKYQQIECNHCLNQIQLIKKRKKMQKQKVKQYQKLKSTCNCMISNFWIKKWKYYLYEKCDSLYLSKGYPMPGPLDNNSLLDGKKCKSDLHKDKDYKVVNIFIWRFFKELYKGGPQIRYKCNKSQLTEQQQQKIKQIKQIAQQIKQTYDILENQSPKKSMIIQKTTSFVQSVRGSQQHSQLSIPE